jgi:hypothetical protein
MYKYCKQSLDFKKINIYKIVTIIVGLLFLSSFTSYMVGTSGKTQYIDRDRENLVMVLNDQENSSFTPQQLYDYIKELNIKYPDIVFAQAVLESGNFKSAIFRSNHNLFGMKEAGKRIRTCKGTEMNHAYYDNWKQSVLDYAFYQASYLNDIKTPEQYLDYLDNNYAEIGNYKNRVNQVISTNLFRLKK